MTRVVFHQHDGSRDEIDARVGYSVMQNAVNNDVPGIVGECGGNLMCATCHVYVEESFRDELAPVSDVEDEMLGVTTAERRPESRLSCQLIVSESLEGLTVEVPETQT